MGKKLGSAKDLFAPGNALRIAGVVTGVVAAGLLLERPRLAFAVLYPMTALAGFGAAEALRCYLWPDDGGLPSPQLAAASPGGGTGVPVLEAVTVPAEGTGGAA